MIGEHLRYLSDFFSAIVKCIRKKYSKKVLFWSHQSLAAAAASIQKKMAKNLYSAFDPLNCPPLLQSLHQINLTIVFIFHFLSLDSIDYIMIILELISPQQRTIEQKYLLTTQKITIIKKRRRPNIVTALLPARDQLQKQQKKPIFGQLTRQKT